MAALPILDLDAWRAGFDGLFARFAGRFVQVQTRRRARAYVLGLLSRTERKNGWTLAEQAGEPISRICCTQNTTAASTTTTSSAGTPRMSSRITNYGAEISLGGRRWEA